MLTQDQMKKKGWDAEAALRKLLDNEGIAHLPFCENQEKYSHALKDLFGTKRPDIMILIRYFGFLLIEVKHKHPHGEYHSFLVDAEEAEKYARFREHFGHEVWYAISNDSDGFKKWYWLPAKQAINNRERIATKNGDCFAVPMNEFIQTESFSAFAQTLLK